MSHADLTPTSPPVTPLLSGRTYDFFKALVTLVLPALGAFYFGLAQIWGFPAGEQVVGSVSLATIFFSVILKVSESSYVKSGAKYDGRVLVDNDPESDRPFLLDLDDSVINTAATKKDLVLKFVDVTPSRE